MNALNPGDACSEVLASPCCAALQIPYDEILDVKVYDSDTLGGDDVRDCTGCSLLLSMAWLSITAANMMHACVMSKADQCVHGCLSCLHLPLTLMSGLRSFWGGWRLMSAEKSPLLQTARSSGLGELLLHSQSCDGQALQGCGASEQVLRGVLLVGSVALVRLSPC